MERMFYFDSEIEKFEKNLEFVKAINYLESKYKEQNNEEILLSLISFSWYYFLEGDINQEPLDYDWEFFRDKLFKFIKLGLNKENDRIYYVLGYIFSISWEYLGQEFEFKGKELMEKCFVISKNKDIKFLAGKFLGKSVETGLSFNKTNCLKLFPSNSLTDDYFRGIIDRIEV